MKLGNTLDFSMKMTITKKCLTFKIISYLAINSSYTGTRLPVSEAEKQPHIMALRPSCLTVGTVFLGLKAAAFRRQT